MPNVATVLKGEISRIARKEMKSGTSVLRKASAQYRKEIAQLKRQVSSLQGKVSLSVGNSHRAPKSIRKRFRFWGGTWFRCRRVGVSG
jgi:hypothetical protein